MDRLERWIDAKPWRLKLILLVQTFAVVGAVVVATHFAP
jgi:hypothetical protein